MVNLVGDYVVHFGMVGDCDHKSDNGPDGFDELEGVDGSDLGNIEVPS